MPQRGRKLRQGTTRAQRPPGPAARAASGIVRLPFSPWQRPPFRGRRAFMQRTYRDELLERHLEAFLGDADPAAIDVLRASLEWVEIAGGETLMRQGEPGDSMYLTISGRLRAYASHEDGA